MKTFQVFAAAAALTVPFTVGCATKNHVRQQLAPIVDKVNDLDQQTAKNTNDIKDVDARAQQGIQGAQAAATQANEKATAAGQSASQAQQTASTAVNRANTLTQTVMNLDNYKAVVETSVHFGFDKWNLSKEAQQALDQMGPQLQSAKNYVVVVDGNTDATGPAAYNAILSRRRADSVIQYLVSKYNVPSFRIHVLGLGEEKPADSNKTRDGRAKNRRVDVTLMTNMQDNNASPQANAGQ
jgi:outer membrane protein OmpA-like peptidoglycan-associated protein